MKGASLFTVSAIGGLSNARVAHSTVVNTNFQRLITNVVSLKSESIDIFRKEAFGPQLPCRIPLSAESLPRACRRWFITNGKQTKLMMAYWADYEHIMVPLEVTRKAANDESATTFERIEAPLALLLSEINQTSRCKDSPQAMYLAQYDLRDLPLSLQDDLPTPAIVQEAGKGDLYGSSLWLGKPPTYTPLHCDSNPNLFLQLAGTKVVRLFSPYIGQAIFDHVQQMLGHSQTTSHCIRGEEMMMGTERSILHDLIWKDDTDKSRSILQNAQEITLQAGQILFIPNGWWHSVKGVGTSVNASANWWFR